MLMSKLKEIQPNTMKVSRRENDAIYHNFEYLEQKDNKNKKGGGYFIERQIRNLKAREDQKRQSLKKLQETEVEKAARVQRQQYMERMKVERDKKFRMNEQIKLDREQMLENVAAIIIKHILMAEIYIGKPSEGAQLFNESN